jgi:hypothetical protein
VYYSSEGADNPAMMNRFKEQGLQIAKWCAVEDYGNRHPKTFCIVSFDWTSLVILNVRPMMEAALDKPKSATLIRAAA